MVACVILFSFLVCFVIFHFIFSNTSCSTCASDVFSPVTIICGSSVLLLISSIFVFVCLWMLSRLLLLAPITSPAASCGIVMVCCVWLVVICGVWLVEVCVWLLFLGGVVGAGFGWDGFVGWRSRFIMWVSRAVVMVSVVLELGRMWKSSSKISLSGKILIRCRYGHMVMFGCRFGSCFSISLYNFVLILLMICWCGGISRRMIFLLRGISCLIDVVSCLIARGISLSFRRSFVPTMIVTV